MENIEMLPFIAWIFTEIYITTS